MIKQLNEITIACKQMTPIRSDQNMQEQLIIERYSKRRAQNLNVNAINTITFPDMQRNACEMFLLYILYTLLKKGHQITRSGGI
jgi:hypothetical protein